MNRDDLKMEDYQVIDTYAGKDRSWHKRVTANPGVDKLLKFSALIASGAICAARYESKEQKP